MTSDKQLAEPYSGLEVVPPADRSHIQYTYDDSRYSTLESAVSPVPPRYPEKQPFLPSHNAAEGLQNTDDVGNNKTAQTSSGPKKKRNKFIICGIIVAVIVVAAIIGGVCGALLNKKPRKTSSINGGNSSSGNSSSNSSSNSPASMKGNAVTFTYYDAPAVTTWGYPHMEVIINNDTQSPLWLSRYPNATSVNDWRTNRPDANNGPFLFLTGQTWAVTNNVVAIARGGNNTDVFTVGSLEHGLWSRYHSSPMVWSKPGWYRVDSTVTSQKTLYSAPGVASWSQNRIDVFALGQNGELWQYYYDQALGGWKGWEDFGGNFNLNFAPTVVTWGQNRYDIFMVNQNSTLAYKYYDGAWSPSQQSDSFFDLGGQLTSRPFAITTQIGRIDVFARGGDAGLWHIVFDGTWGNWSRLGAATTFVKGDPSVVVLGNIMHVFAWSDNNGLLHTTFNWKTGNSQNTQFETIATGLTGAPTAVSDGVNVEVFAHVQNNRLGWKVLTGGKQWTPSNQTMSGLWQY